MWYKLKRIMIRPNGVEKQVRPTIPPYLCFTAGQASSTVTLNKLGTPAEVTLETSTDWITWATYTIWNTITLTNIGDKVYWRNTSETPTWFTTSSSDYYQFNITWLVWASGDIDFLLCKNGTDTLVWSYCFFRLFRNARYLTTPLAYLLQHLLQIAIVECLWVAQDLYEYLVCQPRHCQMDVIFRCSLAHQELSYQLLRHEIIKQHIEFQLHEHEV